MGNKPILTSKLYSLFCFLTLSKWIYSKLSEQGYFFSRQSKNILMGLVVCVRYVLNDIFVQINILRCAYMLTFLLCTCLYGYGTCIRMCIHTCTCLGTEILSHIHMKRTYTYTHGCVYPCVYVYISICICETWTCCKTYECWHRCLCVHEICVCIRAHAYEHIQLRYSHKSIWVDMCNVNAHIYIYIYTCA